MPIFTNRNFAAGCSKYVEHTCDPIKTGRLIFFWQFIHFNSSIRIGYSDVVFFCNIRPDRARQLTAGFVQPHFAHFVVKPIQLPFFITPVKYSDLLQTTVLFPRCRKRRLFCERGEEARRYAALRQRANKEPRTIFGDHVAGAQTGWCATERARPPRL